MNPIRDFIWKVLSFPASAAQVRGLQKVFQKEMIYYALKATYGNKSKAAELLDMNRMTLHKYMKEFGVDKNEFKEF